MSREPTKRTRVERGLYRNGSVYYACATPPGSRSAVWKSLGPVGRMEARRLREEFVAEVRRGHVREASSDRRRRTFAEVADEWLAAQRALVEVGELAPRTADHYELAVRRHLKPTFGARAIRSITPNDLVAWHVGQRQAGAAAWSIKGRWVALRCVLAHAARHGLIQANPADALTSRERPKTGPSQKRFLTEEEMRFLLDAADGRYRVLVAVLLFGGLRISESLGLTWDDVDLATGHLRIRHQLSRKGQRVRLKTATARRDVVVMDALAALLRRHRLASAHSKGSDPVFVTASGTAMSARNSGRALTRIAERAGLVGVTPHALRHTFASLLIARGRDPVFVADQMGHSSPAITLGVYAHLFRATKQANDARDELEAAYGSFLRAADGPA
jgi:integrase